MHLSCHLQMNSEPLCWKESVSYPERRRRRQGQGRVRRLLAAWLGPALLLTGHHPPAERTTFTHTSTGRTPGHHLLTQLATRSRRPYSIHPSYSAALEGSLRRKAEKCRKPAVEISSLSQGPHSATLLSRSLQKHD